LTYPTGRYNTESVGAEGVVREGAGRAGLDLTEEEAALADLAATVARREIAPVAAAAWSAGRCPVEVLRKMGQAGLLGLLIPQEWGGSGATTVGFVAAMEQIGRADQSVAAAWQAHSTIGSLPLLRFGTDEQRDRWLRPLAEGRALGAFGLTEPEAGSDASAIRTRAVRRDDGWVINGRKMFISNAGTSMSFGVTLLARLDEGHGAGAPRYANFVVENQTPGFTLGPKLNGIGWKGLDTRELAFDDVWVPDVNLLGNPGRGLSQFLSVLADLPRGGAAGCRPPVRAGGGDGQAQGGYMLDSDVARFYCDAKILEIGEGTNEIQQLVIARGLP